MHGTPTHRRFEVLAEPVDPEATTSQRDAAPAPKPWAGRNSEPDTRVGQVQVKDATRR